MKYSDNTAMTATKGAKYFVTRLIGWPVISDISANVRWNNGGSKAVTWGAMMPVSSILIASDIWRMLSSPGATIGWKTNTA
jgi:hypothetical protein